MKNNLRFCLVGRGSIGTRHLNNLKYLSYHDITAYSKIQNKEKDANYRDEFGIETVHTIEEVKKIKPDAFIIANPTTKHMELAAVAVDMNSHIFMEKPLSHNLKGVDELKDSLSDNNLVFCLANNFRFHPAVIRIKKLIKDYAFGDIYFARIMAGQYLPDWHPWEDYRQGNSARKQLGGGVVLTLQHEIDYAHWLFGEFKRLKAMVRKVSGLQIDVEDVAATIIESERCPLIEIHLDYLQRPSKRSIQIQGSKGSIDFRFGDRYLQFYDFEQQDYEIIFDLESYDNNHMYVDEIQNFIRCISGEEKPQSGIDDAIYVLKTCLRIKKELTQ